MEGECRTCHTTQRKFYCVECLRTHLREFRANTQKAAQERDTEVARATRSLTIIEPMRINSALLASLRDSITQINHNTRTTRHEVDSLRAQVNELREAIESRRATLEVARQLITTPSAPTDIAQIFSTQTRIVTSRIASAHSSIASTRRVLIKSLVEAFDLREVSQEMSSPSRNNQSSYSHYTQRLSSTSASYIAGASMVLFGKPAFGSPVPPPVVGQVEWSIAGLVLPVPGDFRRYPPEHITAAITHTLHFLRLLTFYLGVKLPFEVTWTGSAPGIGLPSISAGQGTDQGGWVRHTTPHPLYLTSNPSATSSAPSSSQGAPLPSKPSASNANTPPNLTSQFLIGLCMLNYNIAYLSHTQGLDVPLSSTGETLRNLWAICCIGTTDRDALGKFSHSTPSSSHYLPPPTSSPTFALEFEQLVQITNPNSRSFLPDKSSTRPSSSRSKSGPPLPPKRTHRSSSAKTVVTRDGEWDLVDVEEGDEGVG